MASCCTPSADKAQKFFDESKAQVGECSNHTVSVDSGGELDDWNLGYDWRSRGVIAEDTLITQTTQQDAGGWACQHALSRSRTS